MGRREKSFQTTLVGGGGINQGGEKCGVGVRGKGLSEISRERSGDAGPDGRSGDWKGLMGKRVGKQAELGEGSGVLGGDQKTVICLSSEGAVEKEARERRLLEGALVEL